MMTREKLRADFKAYEQKFGVTKDLLILKWFASHCKTAGQWAAFTTLDWIDGKRYWRPTTVLRELARGLDDGSSNYI